MLLITCPCCGVEGEETEFHCTGEAHITRPEPSCSDAEWMTYLFERKNPRGLHFELWRHVYGCGKWFHMARDTASLQIFGTYRVTEGAPPQSLLDRIESATGERT